MISSPLVFWTVGAYNRLVGLRNALAQGFASVDEQFRRRHALLAQLADTLAASLPDAPQPLETLRAACAQAGAACAHARARPGSPGAMTSLRLAEGILGEARGRLPVQALADPASAPLQADLAAGDTTLAFARDQFNAQVRAYNLAVGQFPTWLIASLFGFRRAGTL
jgi:LemA protein